MLKISRVLGLFLLAFTLPIRVAYSQVPTSDGDLKLRIDRLHHQADSLRREAMRLQDSLRGKIGHQNFGNFFMNSDSLLGLGSGRIFGNTNPKNFHFEIPDLPEQRFFGRMPKDYHLEIPDIPKHEKRKAPIKGFNGWYLEELADRGE